MFHKLVYFLLQAWCYFVFKRRVRIFGLFTVGNKKNIIIGDNCVINHGVFLLGRNRIEIGANVVLSARCMLLDGTFDLDHYFDESTEDYKYLNATIIVEDGVWLGAGSIILPNVRIGKNSVVGAGSVVTRDVPPFSIVAGNPARLLRTITPMTIRD